MLSRLTTEPALMQLGDYLARIGYAGPVRADAATLAAIQRAHVRAVPFENLDVQLGVPLTTRVDEAYAKIVGAGRGGWCYEQNGLFGWALEQAGFDVTRVAAAVMRQVRGASSMANHLCLLVRLPSHPETFLADVGFGGSLLAPLPLEEREHSQAPYLVGLSRLDATWWRFTENAGADSFGFDFEAVPGDERAMADKCGWLQTDPGSPFVQNAVVQRRFPDRHVALRGRVLTTRGGREAGQRVIASASEYVDVLRAGFGLDVPQAANLWPAILARHEDLGLDGG
jgi:N-hydroxyarylamine O-acetyltransferase